MSDRQACRSCGAPIRWVVTTHQGRMPLDAEPAPDGNVYIIVGGLRDGMARVLTASELDRARTNCVPLWMSHHATCPGARQHAVPRSQMRMEFG